MKEHEHTYDSDGGSCRICRKTVTEIMNEDDTNWYRKHIQEEKEAKEKARRIEQERIDKIECPSCKSTDKEHIIKSNSNGIFGPGYHSWVIEEYYVCNKCGTMFKDINKK